MKEGSGIDTIGVPDEPTTCYGDTEERDEEDKHNSYPERPHIENWDSPK